ncbi:MAG: hypothetical protein KDD55_10120 [Bdellovibrionales bacterium]|nr:hypothetical protein [Bdellovibrionales bacterium]
MCRLLSVRAHSPFSCETHLRAFAEIARTSKEYQGHGWGLACRKAGLWESYHHISPIWEDSLSDFGETTELLVHARSAFQDEGIVVENNMPFSDEHYVFIFNGELRGVRIQEEGRIGAEKIFNYIKRFDKGDMGEALRRGVSVIEKRTRYVRAMNIIISNGTEQFLATSYNEDPEYFGMWKKEIEGVRIFCSDPYPEEENWVPIANNTVEVI